MRPRRRSVGRVMLASAMAMSLTATVAPPALALPRQRPDATWMVDGTVYALVRWGSNLWIGGSFATVLDQDGNVRRAASNLAVFDLTTGRVARGVHVPAITGEGAVVSDLAVTPRGRVYVAGRFDAIDGLPRGNVAAFNGESGAVAAFSPSVLPAKSVVATRRRAWVGGPAIRAFGPRGRALPGFRPPAAAIDPSLRGHGAAPAFRDLALVGNDLVAACACDSVNGVPTKAVVKIDATTGALRDWRPANLAPTSAAIGLDVLVESENDHVFLAAGGSDFVASYVLSTGELVWREDTSGSAQAVARYGDRLVVGGHFERVGRPGSGGCGSNQVPTGDCWFQPRLVAISAETGVPDTTWTPSVGPEYLGVWALLRSRRALHVGGRFTRVGRRAQWYYARFSERV